MKSSGSSWINRAHPVAIASSRVLGSLLLAYAFIVVLMTAAAQSQVASRLSDLQPKLEYSSGYALLLSYEDTLLMTTPLRRDRRWLVVELSRLKQLHARHYDVYVQLSAPLQSLRRPALIQACNISNAPDALDATTIFAMRQCVKNPSLPAQIKSELEEFLGSSPALLQSISDWQASNRDLQARQAELASVESQIKSFEAVPKATIDVRAAFNEIDILRNRSYLGGDVLVGVPPSITQILLSFFSGMFGGLLLTLVLIVYPKTDLRLSSPESSYGARILLGGLIAVCVFIVLGGGTAVLGTASAFAEGKANFMAFSAVSVLAGMFSDRVAHWLSERADTFFADQKPPEDVDPTNP